MNNNTYVDKFIFFIVGISTAISILLLMGAGTISQVGRYQLQVVMRANFPDLYVIDTTTGRVKWIDSKDENKTFEEIKLSKGH